MLTAVLWIGAVMGVESRGYTWPHACWTLAVNRNAKERERESQRESQGSGLSHIGHAHRPMELQMKCVLFRNSDTRVWDLAYSQPRRAGGSLGTGSSIKNRFNDLVKQ